MSPEFLASIAAVALSLLASYLPGFSNWFEVLEPNHKRLVMLGLLAAAALVCYGLACANFASLLDIPATCDSPGLIQLARALLAAVIANQAAYALTPRDDENCAPSISAG